MTDLNIIEAVIKLVSKVVEKIFYKKHVESIDLNRLIGINQQTEFIFVGVLLSYKSSFDSPFKCSKILPPLAHRLAAISHT